MQHQVSARRVGRYRARATLLAAALFLWPLVAAGQPQPASDFEPMSPVGVLGFRQFGPLDLGIPLAWTWTKHATLPHRFAEAVDPEGGGLLQAGLLDVPAESAASVFDAYVAATAATLLDGSGMFKPMRGDDLFPYQAEGRGRMRWGSGGMQDTTLALRGAMTEEGLALVLVAWTDALDPLAMDDARSVLDSIALAGRAPPADAADADDDRPTQVAVADPDPAILFDGTLDSGWVPISVAGGNFDAFARPAPGLLAVDVPAGQSWGKTGIRSADPVIGASTGPEGLLFRLDPTQTDSFVIALADSAGDDEWGSHVLRLQWAPRAEGGAVAVMFHRQREIWRQDFPDITAPEEIRLTLDPAGAAAFIMPDGIRMEARLDTPPAEGFRLHVIAQPADANLPARLALRGIERIDDMDPAATAPIWPSRPDELVLFDGSLGRAWMPVSIAGGNFAQDATVGPNGLRVAIPPWRGWAAAGIHSVQPAVWLDDFRDGDEIVIEAEIDPAATGSFVLALSASGGSGYPYEAQVPNLAVQRIAATGDTPARYEVHLNPHRDGDFWQAPAPAEPPSRITIRLRPGEAVVELPGAEPVVRAWSDLVEGQGLRIVAYAFEPAQDAGTQLALTRITARRTVATLPRPAPGPAPGVDPLPMTVVFDGTLSPAWEPVGIAGGDFAAFARPSPDGLRIDVPEGNGWGKTGLLSAAPLVTLDSLASRTPTRIDLALDPDIAETLNVALYWDKTPEMWPSHLAWYSLMPDPRRDVWVLGLHSGVAAEWSREINAAWMRDHWDGHVLIDVAEGWTRIGLPEGPSLRAPVSFGAPQAHYATILAHAPQEGAAARLTLRSVSVGRATPEGMSALDRWELVDDAEFDPEAYLDDLAATEMIE